MGISRRSFSEIAIQDPFFDSLRANYAEFDKWFERKSEELAYVFEFNDGRLGGFLYLKVEDGSVDDVEPQLPNARRLKIGTFKVDPHGTRLGDRFMKKVFDHAIGERVELIYVTVFPEHESLLRLFESYGFRQVGEKTTANGTELTLEKDLSVARGSPSEIYPMIRIEGAIHLLSIYPKWHTRLFPDSILRTEDASIIDDVSHTNSIHKVYLAGMRGMENLRPGDVIVIYRTTDGKGPAHYRSVVTSICVVEDYRNIAEFPSREAFFEYCLPFSVFDEQELSGLWNSRKYPHVIQFTYNIALPRRLTRAHLIEHLGIDKDAYWGFLELSKSQFLKIVADSNTNENLIVN